jgi:beta-xylosidase
MAPLESKVRYTPPQDQTIPRPSDRREAVIMRRETIQIRDPFVLVEREEEKYYLYGTTDADPWKEWGIGFDVYTSSDLENWEGPYPAFRPKDDFWGTHNFWAPEVYRYRDSYFMFASFKAQEHERATQILRADSPLGPFEVHSAGPVTPFGWECLDGTFFVEEGRPWLIFSHEWVQVHDGEIWALPLSSDLVRPVGEPRLLFRGSAGGWTKGLLRRDGSGLEDARVTDGPFLYRIDQDSLFLLWSSIALSGYALGVARSESGRIEGPWKQQADPLLEGGRGHGMIFQAFDHRCYIAYHYPNNTPHERLHFREIGLEGARLVARGEEW